MARQPDNGLMYMGLEDIERTARTELAGVVAADRLLDRYDPAATIGRVAHRVASMIQWLRPEHHADVLAQVQAELAEAQYVEAAE